jgi:phosphatidate cytidylyltransferase
MHFKRWMTGIVAAPLLIALIGWGSSGLLAAVVCGVALLSLWEYFRITFTDFSAKDFLSPPAFVFISCPIMMWAAHTGDVPMVLSVAFVTFMALGSWMVVQYDKTVALFESAGKTALAIFYIPVSLALLVAMRGTADGIAWVFMTLCVIFAGDTAAYYIGNQYGTRKLCPRVSPGKTIEGAVGGLAANLLVALIFDLLALEGVSLPGVLMMSLFMGASGQMGDLFESVLKRAAGIKDSGGILPGHGGILDRIDALLFAIPVAYIFKIYLLS